MQTFNEIGTPDSFITAGSGGLSTPGGVTLGSEGNVYVAANGDPVLRYNGPTESLIRYEQCPME